MAGLCTAAEVRAVVNSSKLTDANYESVIDQWTDYISNRSGAPSNSTNVDLIQACIFYSAAAILRLMKFSGELAASVSYGGSSVSNNIDGDIQAFDDMAYKNLRRYLYATNGVNIPYGRVGVRTVDNEL